LHQAVEAKEGVTVREETQTLATITIQNYFRMYEKLAGMTGTAETEEAEFWDIYKLDVVVIPTNRAVRRVDQHDLVYKTRREKYNAIMDEIDRQHKRGLPVLVGTVSVDVSETLSRMLKRRGLRHEVLNAKYHEREAEIVAQAGRRARSPSRRTWPAAAPTSNSAPASSSARSAASERAVSRPSARWWSNPISRRTASRSWGATRTRPAAS